MAVPSAASAVTASGCPVGGDCEFVGGTGHTASTGGATQFRVIRVCADSRAIAVANGTGLIATTLRFNGCSISGFPVAVTCTPSDMTLASGGSGSGTGPLNLSQSNCTFNIAAGLCTIRMPNTVGGQDIVVGVGGTTVGGTAQLTAAISGNTDALTFNSSSAGCGLVGWPSAGSMTFSNSPDSGPMTYDEVGSGLDVS